MGHLGSVLLRRAAAGRRPVLTDGTDLKQTDPSILLPGPTLNAMALSLKAYSTPLLRPMP